MFQCSMFDVVFISTIFPRGEDINMRGRCVRDVIAFNNCLLAEKREETSGIASQSGMVMVKGTSEHDHHYSL